MCRTTHNAVNGFGSGQKMDELAVRWHTAYPMDYAFLRIRQLAIILAFS